MQETVVSHADFEQWAELDTVSTFDTGSTQPVEEMAEDFFMQDIQKFSPTSLLVESLIEQLCKLMEKDPRQQKKLYSVICHKLHQMKLIDQTYGVEEFEFIRSHYQRSLFRLLSVAKATIMNENANALMHLPSLNLELSTVQQEAVLDWSRYRTEYEELEYIDKGGFGRVYKVRNKLDGGKYAIKKMFLRYQNVASFLRSLQEVKMLAQLNHPNIVAYKAAWLEPFSQNAASDLSKLAKSSNVKTSLEDPVLLSTRSRNVPLDQVKREEDSSSIIFEDSNEWTQSCRSKHLKTSTSISKSSATDNSFSDISHRLISSVENMSTEPKNATKFKTQVHQNNGKITKVLEKIVLLGSSESDEQSVVEQIQEELDKAVCAYRRNQNDRYKVCTFENQMSLKQQEWAILYIQMQLCERTLRQWLDERNSNPDASVLDVLQCLAIFRQIVRGVCYIHSQKIVHHDIKPSNIFVNRDMSQVQVGDFGLACSLQHTARDVTVMAQTSSSNRDHKAELGTKLYAAPEQLRGTCDARSDVYSLGIVLFELLQPCTTSMERSKLITHLKAGTIPPELVAQAPKVAHLILRLVSSKAVDRPSAEQLLMILDSLISELSNEGRDYMNVLKSKDDTIKQLLLVISERDREIEMLRLRVQALEAAQ